MAPLTLAPVSGRYLSSPSESKSPSCAPSTSVSANSLAYGVATHGTLRTCPVHRGVRRSTSAICPW